MLLDELCWRVLKGDGTGPLGLKRHPRGRPSPLQSSLLWARWEGRLGATVRGKSGVSPSGNQYPGKKL